MNLDIFFFKITTLLLWIDEPRCWRLRWPSTLKERIMKMLLTCHARHERIIFALVHYDLPCPLDWFLFNFEALRCLNLSHQPALNTFNDWINCLASICVLQPIRIVFVSNQPNNLGWTSLGCMRVSRHCGFDWIRPHIYDLLLNDLNLGLLFCFVSFFNL